MTHVWHNPPPFTLCSPSASPSHSLTHSASALRAAAPCAFDWQLSWLMHSANSSPLNLLSIATCGSCSARTVAALRRPVGWLLTIRAVLSSFKYFFHTCFVAAGGWPLVTHFLSHRATGCSVVNKIFNVQSAGNMNKLKLSFICICDIIFIGEWRGRVKMTFLWSGDFCYAQHV